MNAKLVGIRFEHEITNQISTTFPRKMSVTIDKHSIIETHELCECGNAWFDNKHLRKAWACSLVQYCKIFFSQRKYRGS